MATPNLYANSKADPFKDVPASLQTSQVNLIYATDRQAIPNRKSELRYGYGRSLSLAFGECAVEIGHNLSWEQLVKISRSRDRFAAVPIAVKEIHQTGSFPATPTPLVRKNDDYVDDPETLARIGESEQQLRALISRHLERAACGEVFIYVHGFNNTFEYAACVMGQIWHFLGRKGVPIIYSWPAGSPDGALGGYTHDRESGEFTGYHLKQFLRTVAACPSVKKLHLIAHSRGTDVVMTALRELNIEDRSAGKSTHSALKLGNMVMAAPDLDVEVTTQRTGAERLLQIQDRLTVYVSPTDRAIGIADLLFGSKQRIGQIRFQDLTAEQRKALESLPQVNFVEARVRAGLIGHDYFFSNPAVSSDVILVLRDNLAPGAANGRPLIKRQENYWEIDDSYPQDTRK
jgi:esterase/lipase superfamily enzyme